MKKLLYFAIAFLTAGVVFAQYGKFTPQEKLIYAEKIIKDYYVDTVNEDKLVEAALKSMLEELDPHSAYSNPEETRELNEP